MTAGSAESRSSSPASGATLHTAADAHAVLVLSQQRGGRCHHLGADDDAGQPVKQLAHSDRSYTAGRSVEADQPRCQQAVARLCRQRAADDVLGSARVPALPTAFVTRPDSMLPPQPDAALASLLLEQWMMRRSAPSSSTTRRVCKQLGQHGRSIATASPTQGDARQAAHRREMQRAETTVAVRQTAGLSAPSPSTVGAPSAACAAPASPVQGSCGSFTAMAAPCRL